MSISAHVVADSIGFEHGIRITTLEVVAPKPLLAQINTHRMLCRNWESSRARPTKGILEQVQNDPYKPRIWFGRQRGMQPADPLTPPEQEDMHALELELRLKTLEIIRKMEKLEASKEDINRYLEPWMYATGVITATEWENYLALRTDTHAQGPHRQLALMIRDAIAESQPVRRSAQDGDAQQWHLPYVTAEERAKLLVQMLPQISAARIARVSYGRPGQTTSLLKDLIRTRQLIDDGHWSALEGPARVLDWANWIGPLHGWASLRKHYAGESGTTAHGCQEDIGPWAYRTNLTEEDITDAANH